MNESLMEKSGLNVFANFQYRQALQKEGPEVLSKLDASTFACATPQEFQAEEVGGFEGRAAQLENWAE